MSRAEEIPVEDSTSCCQLVGNSPTLEPNVGGIVTRFLVDTGSQVTTISESFYRTHLAKAGNDMHRING